MRVRAAGLTLLVTLAIFWSASMATAQEKRVRKIGVLAATRPEFAAPFVEVGRVALRDRGWVEGRDVTIEYRYAAGKLEQLPGLAAELVALNVDVIVAFGDITVQAAKEATRKVPIVAISVSDPVGSGFVSSLARPGGNITGVASQIPELNAKMLSILKEIVPRASRVAVLWNPISLGGVLGFKEIQKASRELGVTVNSLELRKVEDLEKGFAALTAERADAMVVLTDPITFNRRAQVIEFAAKQRLPGIYEVREFVDEGGLIAYGPSLASMVRRAVSYVDKILRGARPGDLPVEQPTTFELAVNLRTARALGLTIPQAVLFRADFVLQ